MTTIYSVRPKTIIKKRKTDKYSLTVSETFINNLQLKLIKKHKL